MGFVVLDEFWVADEETGEVIKDDFGEIIVFKSSDLLLAAKRYKPPPASILEERGLAGSCLILGKEPQMMSILEQFGSPDLTERNEPQQLLAIPCHMCELSSLLMLALEGVDESIHDLAQNLRPDIHVTLRALHLKRAVEQLGPELLHMEGYFLLAAVTLPYSWEDIEESTEWLNYWRKEICNQIDLSVTASSHHRPGEVTPEAIAQRALGETCGIKIADRLWEEKVQLGLRRHLNLDIPCKFADVNGTQVSVLIIPDDVVTEVKGGILNFMDGPQMEEYVNALRKPAAIKTDDAPKTIQEKNVAQWTAGQQQFKDLPSLPPGWLRITSKKTGEIYFFNKQTQESTFDFPKSEVVPVQAAPAQATPALAPLPEGWTEQVSKSTGKSYYFNAAKRKSQFERPTS